MLPIPVQLSERFKPNTKAIYLESPANPTLKVVGPCCLRKNCKRARGYVRPSTTPLPRRAGQQPITFGFDLVVHSMTKYLSGNSTVVAGVIVGSKEFTDSAKKGALRNFGGVISPFNAWLTLHGVATLPLRFERHCANARRARRNFWKIIQRLRGCTTPVCGATHNMRSLNGR